MTVLAALRQMATRGRADLVRGLRAILPWVAVLGVPEDLQAIAETLLDVGAQWE